jgi:hypothetical protein
VHDYFDIIGVSRHAPADEIRRASARRAWKWHPDADIAVDFIDMSAVVERMQVAFLAALRPDD